MTELFLKLLNMSISASYLVLAVMAARFVLKKAPRWILCSLWALVAIRLVCPVSFESVLSLIPDTKVEIPQVVSSISEPVPSVPENTTLESTQYLYYVNEEGKIEGPAAINNEELQKMKVSFHLLSAAGPIWILGMVGLLLYAALSYLRIRRQVAASVSLGNEVYLCDYIQSPFILGIFRPRIYLPSSLSGQNAAHVLAHERAHLKRRDHWWKPLGFLLLTVYWFNPLMWIAYILLCRDIELACDERVIRELGTENKKAYSEALLSCSIPRYLITACPLAFGEVGVKERVKSVLNYKKPAFWIIAVAVIVSIVVAACFLTDPPGEAELESPFGKYYQVGECIYNGPNSEISYYQEELTRTLLLTNTKSVIKIIGHIENRGFDTLCNLSDLTLSEENFDTLFQDGGELTGYRSIQKIREENANAWGYYDPGYGYSNDRAFYYVLQQKDGKLLLIYGNEWTAEYKKGISKVYWIFELEQVNTDNPYVDADTPYQWTRNIREEDIQEISFTALNSDGTPGTFLQDTDFQEELLWSLNRVREDELQKGTGVADPEVTVYLYCLENGQWNEKLDVLLRYGGGKADLVFHSDAPYSYADTGSQVWEIHNQHLINCLMIQSEQFFANDPFHHFTTPYEWAKSLTSQHVRSVMVDVLTLEYRDGFFFPSKSEIDQLISILNALPEDRFVETEIHTQSGCSVLISSYAQMDTIFYYANLECIDNEIYLTFNSSNEDPRAWKIQYKPLYSYLQALSDPARITSNVVETVYDTISYSYLFANMTLMRYNGWEYEIVEYTNDETPFGIRFRPEGMDGWMFLQFRPDGFSPDGVKPESIPNYDDLFYFDLIGDRCYHEGNFYWKIDTPGCYVLTCDSLTKWMLEYQSTIYSSIRYSSYTDGNYVVKESIGSGILRLEEALEIANSSGLSEEAYMHGSFDWKTGIWTVEPGTYVESPLVLQIDAEGRLLESDDGT